MNVEILSMKRAKMPDKLAHFKVAVDGWTLHGCSIYRKPDGFIGVASPRGTSLHGRAVEPPRDVWLAIVHAALKAYSELPEDGDEQRLHYERPDAGLRRVLESATSSKKEAHHRPRHSKGN